MIEIALKTENCDALRQAVASGESVDLRIEGFTPLSAATQMNSPEFCRVLLDAGADVNRRNDDGTTALTWSQNGSMAALLASHGASAALEKPNDGYTSLHCAAEDGDLERARVILISADGTKVLEKFDYIYRTPLACAAQCGHDEVVALLLRHGSNRDAVDDAGWGVTPLQFALEEGQCEAARLLLEAGANPLRMTRPPRELAEERGCLELLARYFNPTKQGETS